MKNRSLIPLNHCLMAPPVPEPTTTTKKSNKITVNPKY